MVITMKERGKRNKKRGLISLGAKLVAETGKAVGEREASRRSCYSVKENRMRKVGSRRYFKI